MEIKGIALTDQLKMLRGVEHVSPINPNQGGIEKAGQSNKPSFVDFLKDQLTEVNQMGVDTDKRIANSVAGTDPNPHATMIAIQEADISFRLMLTVKDKLVQAYEQLIRTPVG